MKKIDLLSVRGVTKIVSIIGIALLLYSCILTSEEENFREIDVQANPGNVASLTYSYDQKDFFPIKDSLWISNQFHLRLQGGFVYDFEVRINDDVFRPFGEDVEEVSLTKQNLSDSYNIVTVRQRVKSGTGSLADKSGAEYAEFQSQFVLVRDDNAFIPAITSIAFEDGTVRVRWKEYTRSDFQHYKLVKTAETLYGAQEYRSFTFNNQQQNFFLDTTYVGGTISYKLVVNNGGDMTSAAYPFNYAYNPSAILTKTGSNFNLSFTPPPFHKNVKFYETVFYNHNMLNRTQVITTEKLTPDDLSMHIPGPILFGPTMKYEITCVPKVDILKSGDERMSTGFVNYGTKIKSYRGQYVHDVNTPVYFCYVTNSSGGTLYKIDDTTFKAIDSASFPVGEFARIIISANGNYYYCLTGSAAVRFNPTTLSVISTTSYSSLGNSISFLNSGTRVTDNNFIFFSGYESGNFPCVVDMNTNTKIYTSDNRSVQSHLSSDGNFLLIGFNVFKYSGGTYVFDHSLPYDNVTYRQFIDHEPAQLFISTISSIIIYDYEAKSELFSTAAQLDYNKIVVDQYSKKVVGEDFGRQVVFDIATRTLTTVPVAPLYAFFSGDTFFSQRLPLNPYHFALKDYY